jgi:hypothetical protein
MLQKELSGHKAMIPDLYNCTIVDGVAQVSQSHVEFVHSCKVFSVLAYTFYPRLLWFLYLFTCFVLWLLLLGLYDGYTVFGKELVVEHALLFTDGGNNLVDFLRHFTEEPMSILNTCGTDGVTLFGTQTVCGVHEVSTDHGEDDGVPMLGQELHTLLKLMLK